MKAPRASRDLVPSPDFAVVARMQRRVRALRALRGAVELAVPGAAFAVAAMLLGKLGLAPDPVARRLLLASLAFPAVGAAVAGARAVPTLLAARLIDRHAGLDDRVPIALQFLALPDDARTPMVDAAIDDARARVIAARPDPVAALPWRWPWETRVAL